MLAVKLSVAKNAAHGYGDGRFSGAEALQGLLF
jgi:hypothetical protein